MRAGVNVSAFYPMLERVLTECADNAISAVLKMLADRGDRQSFMWVLYEGTTLTIRDQGPGKTDTSPGLQFSE
jgi:hypothetical protein